MNRQLARNPALFIASGTRFFLARSRDHSPRARAIVQSSRKSDGELEGTDARTL